MTIFCGKGGTGRTSISFALGLSYAMRGLRTVIVTSHPLTEVSSVVSLAGLQQAHPVAAANLFVVRIDPIEVLNNTVRQKLPSALLVKAVLSSKVYQSLVEVAPGLKEIAFLNRLRQLSEDQKESGQKFDRLVWDAPATGHFLQMLRVSRNFDTYLSGPFALLGAQITRLFSDAARFSVIPVATLEEMAVQETVELCQQLQELGIGTRDVICNLTSPLAASEEPLDAVFAKLAGSEADVKFLRGRIEIERLQLRTLRDSVKSSMHLVRRKTSWSSDLDLLFELAGQVAPAAGEAL
ncbi:MAG TPA: ArsA family ATPase [Candidatus Sulfopaludibacter sp.]|nr:ArsA family ATPase [Candidatus Sulfopaludibacter sp.]